MDAKVISCLMNVHQVIVCVPATTPVMDLVIANVYAKQV